MVEINRNMCMYCGACAGSCPTLALILEETIVCWHEEKCINCGICERVCPVGAISL